MKRLLLVLAAAVVPATAHANGRFPDTIDVIFKPGDHAVFGLAVTWGFLVTTDGGATFRWSCEEAIGFGGRYDPDYTFTPTGLLLATTTSQDGLRMTRDFCTWTPAPAPLGPPGGDAPGVFIAQIEAGPDGVIFAMASTGTDSQLYVSSDDGASWAPRSDPGGGVDWWETLTRAPSTTGATTRLYLAGYNLEGSVKSRVLFRSDDAGMTWATLPTTAFTFGGDLADLQIAAVSPTDPDLVFARVYQANGNGIGDDIYRSTDAGQSWTRVLQSGDDVTAVVVRANGDVIATTGLSGTHVSTDGGATFGDAVSADVPLNCMRERDDGMLFACGKSFPPNNMALGTGATIAALAPIFTFAETCEPVQCSAGSVQYDVCELQRWPATVQQFGIEACAGGVPDAGPTDGGITDPPKEKCTDCSSGAGGPGTMAFSAALVALVLARRRRRR